MSAKTETAQVNVLASETGRYVVASLVAEFEQFSLLMETGKQLAAQLEISAPVIVVTPLAEHREAESLWLYLISITSRRPIQQLAHSGI